MWGWGSYCIALLWTLLTVPRRYFFCGSFVILFVCLSCFHVCSLLPCGHMMEKGWPLGYRLWCLIASLSLSNVVSLVRCGTWLYWFLIFAFFLTLELTPCFITVRLTVINRVYAQSSQRKAWHSWLSVPQRSPIYMQMSEKKKTDGTPKSQSAGKKLMSLCNN